MASVNLADDRPEATIEQLRPVGSGYSDCGNRAVVLTRGGSGHDLLQSDRGCVEDLALQCRQKSLIAPVTGMATRANGFLMETPLERGRRIDCRADVIVKAIEVVPLVKPAEEDHPLVALPLRIEVREIVLIQLRNRRSKGHESDRWQSLAIDGP